MLSTFGNTLRNIIFALLLLVIGIIASLVGGELLFRALGFEADGTRQRFLFDNTYTGVAVDSWFWEANFNEAQGSVDIRGDSVPFEKPESEHRILFVGDSGTYGFGVARLESFPSQFEKLLKRERGEDVRVINVGLRGTDNVTQLNAFKEKFYKLKPDTVVLGIYYSNDLISNMVRVRNMKAGNLYPVLTYLKARSALFYFLYLRFQILNSQYKFVISSEESSNVVPFELAPLDDNGLNLQNLHDAELATYIKNKSSRTDAMYESLAEIFSEFKRLGDLLGYQFAVAFIPTSSRVLGCLKPLHTPYVFEAEKKKNPDSTHLEVDVNQPIERTLEICEEIGLTCVDPTPEFRPHRENVFNVYDHHLNAMGNSILAQKLFAYFDASSLRFSRTADLDRLPRPITPRESLYGPNCEPLSLPKLSGINPFHYYQSWGEPKLNTNVFGGVILSRGQVYREGFGVHADSELFFRLDGQYKRFTSGIGTPDYEAAKATPGTLEFLVYGDDVELFNSGLVRSGQPIKRIDLSVAGVKVLKLIVSDYGDGFHSDAAFWIEPRLYK